MKLKHLFIKEDESAVPQKVSKSNLTNKFDGSFPDSNRPARDSNLFDFSGKSKSSKPASTVSCEPYIADIMDIYEKGFESLNQDGYDFYEFFKSVLEAGVDSEVAYNMAYKLGKTMNGQINKKLLLNQANFYIEELKKVHENFTSKGESKRREINSDKFEKENSLKSELASIDKQILMLQKQRETISSQLESINNVVAPELAEIDCKLQANDMAKDKLVDSIDTVVANIKKYVSE